MPRLTAVDPAAASGKPAELFSAVKAKLGLVPNMMRTMANAPAALEGYLAFSEALAHGALGPKIREAIALGSAQHTECDYCAAAHAVLGRNAGLNTADINDARRYASADSKSAAALAFARVILETQGAVGETDVAAVKAAGFTDGQVAEIVANVALNWFTNVFNKVTEPVVDFPKVDLGAPVA